jgi:hypothetical protein
MQWISVAEVTFIFNLKGSKFDQWHYLNEVGSGVTVDQHINLQGQLNGFRMSSSNLFLGEIRFSLAFMSFENKIIRPETRRLRNPH